MTICPEFNRLTTEKFKARLKQEDLVKEFYYIARY